MSTRDDFFGYKLMCSVVGSETPTLDQLTERSWMWMVDMQKTCSLLIGHCLGVMLTGNTPSQEEVLCRHWLSNEIFSYGIKNEEVELKALMEVPFLATSKILEPIYVTLDKLPQTEYNIIKLLISVPFEQSDQASPSSRDDFDNGNNFFERLMENVEADTWEFNENERRTLDTVVKCFLMMVLKQTDLLQKNPSHPSVKEVFKYALNLRHKLVNLKCFSKYQQDEMILKDEKDFSPANLEPNLKIDKEFNFEEVCQDIIQKCLFFIVFVKGGFNEKLYFYYPSSEIM